MYHYVTTRMTLPTQREYVAGCLAWYLEVDLQQGNPEDGDWHDCHYPVPKSLGGTTTVKLLKQHHAVQGVLQSEEYQHPCVWWWEKQYLEGELLELFEKWRAKVCQLPRPGNWEHATPERRSSVLAAVKRAGEARKRPVSISGPNGSETYASVYEAAASLGVSYSLVSLWLSGKKHSYRQRGLTVSWAV
jgi:hypothetical protein